MKQGEKTTVCQRCEADVSEQATYCPFCGAEVMTPPRGAYREVIQGQDKTLPESLASLYKPPYSVRNKQGLGVPDEREEGAYKEVVPHKENPLFHARIEGQGEAKGGPLPRDHEGEPGEGRSGREGRRGNLLPLIFLMTGAHLLALATLILFCSKDGVVTLHGKGGSSFLYCLASMPFLYFGVRMLKRLGG